jgi:hypothetical protein
MRLNQIINFQKSKKLNEQFRKLRKALRIKYDIPVEKDYFILLQDVKILVYRFYLFNQDLLTDADSRRL